MAVLVALLLIAAMASSAFAQPVEGEAEPPPPIPTPTPRPGNLQPPGPWADGRLPIEPDDERIVLPAEAGAGMGIGGDEADNVWDEFNPLYWIDFAANWLDENINGELAKLLVSLKNEEAERGQGWLELHPRYRFRLGETINADLDTSRPDYRSPLEDRTRFDLHFHTSILDLHLQLQNAVDYSLPSPAGPGEDTWDISQLWVKLTTFDGSPVRFQLPLLNTWVRLGALVGRTTLTLSRGRLIGSDEWRNTGQGFEIATLALKEESSTGAFTILFGWPVLYKPTEFNTHGDLDKLFGWVLSGLKPFGSLDDEDLGSFHRALMRPGDEEHWLYPLHNSREWRLGHGLDLWVLWLHHELMDLKSESGRNGGMDLLTLGGRVGALLDNSYLELELNIQVGDIARDPVVAWAVHGEINIGFDALVPMTVELYADIASGDSNPNDEFRGTFRDLFPNLHGRFGLIDLFRWSNMVHLGAGFRAEVAPMFVIRTALHVLRVYDEADAIYGASGAPIAQPGVSGVSGELGLVFDAEVLYYYSERVKIAAGYSYFRPGGRLTAVGLDDAAEHWYLQIKLGF